MEIQTNWENEYRRIKGNPIYFIEMYYNKVHLENPVDLTDDEKQQFFNQYRKGLIPLIDDWEKHKKWEQELEELRKKGYKDWEIF